MQIDEYAVQSCVCITNYKKVSKEEQIEYQSHVAGTTSKHAIVSTTLIL
jgi:hypothetical protein